MRGFNAAIRGNKGVRWRFEVLSVTVGLLDEGLCLLGCLDNYRLDRSRRSHPNLPNSKVKTLGLLPSSGPIPKRPSFKIGSPKERGSIIPTLYQIPLVKRYRQSQTVKVSKLKFKIGIFFKRWSL
jgi:hypothetical protein